MGNRYTVAAFDDAAPYDVAHDLAAMVDYLIESETETSNHYGLVLWKKIIRDNLSALAERIRVLSDQQDIPVETAQDGVCVTDLTRRVNCNNEVM